MPKLRDGVKTDGPEQKLLRMPGGESTSGDMSCAVGGPVIVLHEKMGATLAKGRMTLLDGLSTSSSVESSVRSSVGSSQ